MEDIAPSSDGSSTPPPPPSPATDDIRHFLGLIDALRLAIPPPDCSPAAIHSTQPLLLLHSLRPLHRSIHCQLDERRTHLQRLYRRGVDGINIERASWQYEKDWFEREIQRQQQYVSNEKQIELISEEQFRHRYPDAPTDRHQLHIARLQDELAERKRLVAQVEAVRQQSAQLAQSNTVTRQHLTTLTTTLVSLAQSTTPLYDTFFPATDEQVYRPVPDVARNLPIPLWQLLCVAWSYVSAEGTEGSVTVRVVEATDSKKAGVGGSEKGGDADSVWRTHPLSVVVRVAVEAAAAVASIDLHFCYLPTLQLVSVLVKRVDGDGKDEQEQNPIGHIASLDSTARNYSELLYELYPNDDGTHLLTHHLSSLSSTSAPASIGCVYMWCQQLCGLHHPVIHKSAVDVTLGDVILLTRQRLEQRPIIEQQIQRYQLKQHSNNTHQPHTHYNRHYTVKDVAVSVDVHLPHAYPVRPPRFTLSHMSGQSGNIDGRKLRALESELNSKDMGNDVYAITRLMEHLERHLSDCL